MTNQLPKLTINCGEEQDAYQVVLTGEGLKAYKGASNEKGEALVAAILATPGVLTTANFFEVERKKNGALNSGPNGQYSHQVFNAAGNMIEAYHHLNGQLNDNALTGEPAMQEFHGITRALEETWRYRNGKESDGAKKGQDGHVVYSDIGTPVTIEHYREGRLVKKLSPAKISRLNTGRTFKQRLARVFSSNARKAHAAEKARVAAALQADSAEIITTVVKALTGLGNRL